MRNPYEGLWHTDVPVVRGKMKRTAIADSNADFAEDFVKREFNAPEPDKLRATDFTYVSARTGRCYAAFITDVYAGRG
ncbi:hypothetical protein FACS1894167_04740 [Synergistales bacterium]|nr:hypothetical protein FACS1894167_04740 [Synergistales bacterium]